MVSFREQINHKNEFFFFFDKKIVALLKRRWIQYILSYNQLDHIIIFLYFQVIQATRPQDKDKQAKRNVTQLVLWSSTKPKKKKTVLWSDRLDGKI